MLGKLVGEEERERLVTGELEVTGLGNFVNFCPPFSRKKYSIF